MESIYVVFIVVFFILVIITLIAVVIYLFSQLRQAQAQAQGKNENLIKDYEGKIREITVKHQHDTEKARQQSVTTSRHTIKGQIAEQLAPLLPGFSYLPSDSHFIGDPIDYIVFNGYTDFRDKHILNDSFEVVILDIKHNTASLTEGQKAIARAIENGKVRFEIVRILEDGTVQKTPWGSLKKNQSTPQEDIDPLENIPHGYRNMYLFLQKYPKAYEPWDEADDKLLKESFFDGLSVSEIAHAIKRNPGRVQARIKEKELKRDNT